MNANQVFNWLKDPKFADATPSDVEPRFLPVEVIDAAADEPTVTDAGSNDACSDPRLEIDLAGGHRLRVIGAYDAEALALLIRRLSV